MPRARKDPPPPWGSITRRTTSKGRERFRVRYEVPGHDGKRIQRSETVGSWQAGLDLLQRRELELLEGPSPARRDLTLAAYLDEWLASLPGGPAGEATQGLYAQAVRLWIVPTLGSHRLEQITPADVRRALQHLTARGLAASTVRQARKVLILALGAAVEGGTIATNPAKRVKVAGVPRKLSQVWDADQSRQFLVGTNDTPDGPLWRLLLDTGMRIGEALALAWDDVDLDKRMVTIRRTLSRDRARRTIVGSETKTRQQRQVPLTALTVTALRRHVAAIRAARLAAVVWQDQGMFFPAATGAFHAGGTIRSRFEREIIRVGVPRITVHGLRHTNATLLIRAGVPIPVVSKRLGHASVSMTLNVYAHVIQDMEDAATAEIEALFASTA